MFLWRRGRVTLQLTSHEVTNAGPGICWTQELILRFHIVGAEELQNQKRFSLDLCRCLLDRKFERSNSLDVSHVSIRSFHAQVAVINHNMQP